MFQLSFGRFDKDVGWERIIYVAAMKADCIVCYLPVSGEDAFCSRNPCIEDLVTYERKKLIDSLKLIGKNQGYEIVFTQDVGTRLTQGRKQIHREKGCATIARTQADIAGLLDIKA
jgi:hypothetical protein